MTQKNRMNFCKQKRRCWICGVFSSVSRRLLLLFHIFIKESIDFFRDELIGFFAQLERAAQHAPCDERTVKMGEKKFRKERDRCIFFQLVFFFGVLENGIDFTISFAEIFRAFFCGAGRHDIADPLADQIYTHAVRFVENGIEVIGQFFLRSPGIVMAVVNISSMTRVENSRTTSSLHTK